MPQFSSTWDTINELISFQGFYTQEENLPAD